MESLEEVSQSLVPLAEGGASLTIVLSTLSPQTWPLTRNPTVMQTITCMITATVTENMGMTITVTTTEQLTVTATERPMMVAQDTEVVDKTSTSWGRVFSVVAVTLIVLALISFLLHPVRKKAFGALSRRLPLLQHYFKQDVPLVQSSQVNAIATETSERS